MRGANDTATLAPDELPGEFGHVKVLGCRLVFGGPIRRHVFSVAQRNTPYVFKRSYMLNMAGVLQVSFGRGT
jgi:hypothetical protein